MVHEPHDEDRHCKAQEVVHLEQKSKGASLALEDDRVDLNELINSCKGVVDKQQPVDEVVCDQILGIGVGALVGEESTLEAQSEGSESEADDDGSNLIDTVNEVILAKEQPQLVCRVKALTLIHFCRINYKT